LLLRRLVVAVAVERQVQRRRLWMAWPRQALRHPILAKITSIHPILRDRRQMLT